LASSGLPHQCRCRDPAAAGFDAVDPANTVDVDDDRRFHNAHVQHRTE
jgi:hypothetical protein